MVTISSVLQQYPISDLLRWYKEKTLILNPDFQRRDNWNSAARSYLIDTLLRGMPIPNIYFRMNTDTQTQTSHREVVDGQQRLRTIFGFIDGAFALTSNAKEYSGKKYDDLDVEEQRKVLSYQLGAVQLFDASDDVVLDVFHRLNAYGLSLNQQELRHGKFQGGRFKGGFRKAVIDASDRWVTLWDTYKVVSVRARVRMGDHDLMAQMFGVLIDGVVDGGQPYINKLYERLDDGLLDGFSGKLDFVVRYIITNFPEVLGTRLANAPHFLMLFAAAAHAYFGIPLDDAGDPIADPNSKLPLRSDADLADLIAANTNLMFLASILEMPEEEIPERFEDFVEASASSTQRIRSRSIRFAHVYKALQPEEM